MIPVIDTIPKVDANEGLVLVDGPGLVATLSPDVALEVGEALHDKAVVAAGQRVRREASEVR